MNKHNKNAKNDDYTMSTEMIFLSSVVPKYFGINSFVFMFQVQ